MKKDIFGRTWNLSKKEVCRICGQPDNSGDCNHKKLTDTEVKQLQEG